MITSSSPFKIVILFIILMAMPVGMVAQKGGRGGGTGKPPSGGLPPLNTPQPTTTQTLFISGRVMIEGGGAPSESVAIERVCSGVARRQGYTDAKGSFQFQIDQNAGYQDASETVSNITGNELSATSSQTADTLKIKYQGCEFRAVLPGYLSGTVPLRLEGSAWQYDVGTIFLKRLDNVTGATISATSLNAPPDARRAYEKARKEFDQNKYPEAEKELDKAVKAYPQYAAAWSLLGDIHQQQKQLDMALKEYTQAIAADPQFVNPRFGLALIAVQQKRWMDAAQLTEQVSKMNAAAYPTAFFYNAVANYNAGRFDPAEESAKKFKSLDTEHHHPDICLLLGQIYIHKQDYAGAAQEMRDYLTVAPNALDAEQARATLKQLEAASTAKK